MRTATPRLRTLVGDDSTEVGWMAYLTLLIPAVALVGALLVERLERWAVGSPDDPGGPGEDRVTGAQPGRG